MRLIDFKTMVDNFKTEGLTDYGKMFLQGLKEQLEDAIKNNKEYIMYYPPNKPIYKLTEKEKDRKALKLPTITMLMEKIDKRQDELISMLSGNQMTYGQIDRYKVKKKVIEIIENNQDDGSYIAILQKEAEDKGVDVNTYISNIKEIIAKWEKEYNLILLKLDYFRIKAKSILLTEDEMIAINAINRLNEITFETTLEDIDNMFTR